MHSHIKANTTIIVNKSARSVIPYTVTFFIFVQLNRAMKAVKISNRQRHVWSGAHRTEAAEKRVELIKELMKTTGEEKKNNNIPFFSLRRSNLKERQEYFFYGNGY